MAEQRAERNYDNKAEETGREILWYEMNICGLTIDSGFVSSEKSTPISLHDFLIPINTQTLFTL